MHIVQKLSMPLILASSLVLAGCSGFDVKEIFVSTEPVEKPALDLSDPSPIRTKPVKWIVITPENYEEVFSDMKENNYDLVLFGLTDDGYKNLSLNFAEMRKYIVEQKQILKAYKQYYEPKHEEKE